MDKAQVVGAAINRDRYDIAVEIVDAAIHATPREFTESSLTRERLLEYALHDISKLFVAIISNRPSIFRKYVEWQRSMFLHRHIPMMVVRRHLEALESIVLRRLDPEGAEIVRAIIAEAYAGLDSILSEDLTYLDPEAPLYGVASRYLELLRNRHASEAIETVLHAVDEGLPILRVYLEVIQPVQHEVGRLWQRNELTVSEEHYATDATRTLMSRLRGRFTPVERRGISILTACLGGELHDIGARMVSDFFELSGFDSYFTGANTPHDQIVEEIHRHNPQVLALSATMTLQVRLAYELIDQVRREFDQDVHILVGGYAFNENPGLWTDVGADSFAPNAQDAIVMLDERFQR